MDVVAELLAAIGAQPDDPDPQLVLADHLLSAGDPRGELIVLDHLDRRAPGGLTDLEAIDRLLVLAATYGFPRARDEVEPMLPFGGGESHPVHYELHHEGRRYTVDYNYRGLTVSVLNPPSDIDDMEEYPDGVPSVVAAATLSGATYSEQWTEEEGDVILTLLSDALRAGTPLRELQFPYTDDALPQYPGAPLRAYWLPAPFVAAHGLSRDRHGLAARDYRRWHALWDLFQIQRMLSMLTEC